MKHFVSVTVVALSVASAARADHPEAFAEARRSVTVEDWPQCLRSIDAAVHDRDAHVDGSSKVGTLAKPVGALAAGATPSAGELRAECVKLAKADPDRARTWQHLLELYVSSVRGAVVEMQKHPYDYGYDTVAKQARACREIADLASEVLGGDATIALPWGSLPAWNGTVSAAKTEICGAAQEAADAMKAQRLAPFVKAGIKNGKLKILDDYNISVEIGVPGGTFTLEPATLARANPWFSESSGGDCGGGKVTTHLHRYAFDRDQKLAKETAKDYCGAVPKSAYR